MPIVIDGTGTISGVNATGISTAQTVNASNITTGTLASAYGGTGTTAGVTGFKNRIINGAMVIDQRNAGAAVTITNTSVITYVLDRWFGYGSAASKFSVQQDAGAVTPPAGFTDYLGVTSLAATSVGSSDYYFVGQYIEGFNTADLAFGTANAKTITMSFWVRSSLTGTFGGSVANTSNTRSFPFSYTINSANTWEQKSVTITGDTSGTWVGATNGVGIRIFFSVGMGSSNSTTAGAWASGDYRSSTGSVNVVSTNGATLYITGVQLEVGSTATSFDYRPYTTELQLCQRYYQQTGGNGAPFGNSSAYSSTFAIGNIFFPVTMRTKPTGISTTGSFAMFTNNSSYAVTLTYDDASTSGVRLVLNGSGLPSTGSFDFRASGTATIGFTGAEL